MKMLLALLIVASDVLAQVTGNSMPNDVPNDVPSDYTSLYQSVESNISAFAALIPAQSSSQPTSTLMSGDLLFANGNSGLKLLTAARQQNTQEELARLKSLGLTAVTVTMGLPLMNEDFYTFNGDPQDFQSMLTVYQNLQKSIHQSGMKMIVESAVLFPGYFSANSGFNLTGYYASLSDTDYVAARAKNVLTIAQQVGPDYINLNSEPDTDLQLTGRTNLYSTPQAFAAMNETIITQVRAQSITIPIGAGVGTWLNGQAGATEWVQALLGTDIDYLDLHIYATNYDFLPNAITYADMALEAGKQVAISECWDVKETDQEFSGTTVNNEAIYYARDTFSFWAPVDTAFVEAFVNFANWKGLIYVSPFWTRYFWAYLNYNQEQSAGAALDMSAGVAEQVLNDATVQFVNAIQNSTPPTFSGQTYQGAIATAEVKAVTSVSAADYGVTVAPNSIVSLFAANIATQVSSATNPPPAPLPTSLGGVSATITDSSGNATPISLIAVTPSQMNAVLPAGLQAGPAVVNLTTSSGARITGDAMLATAAPSLFSANETGRGTAAAQVVIGHADGSQTLIPAIATCSSSGCTPIPINLGSSTDQAYLVLFGTGIRGAGGASAVTATVGNTACNATYAGPQNTYFGLDQVNVELPHSLAGSGTVNVVITAAGETANTVTVDIQ
jgi:uncharacterized protein (TIGR03437 family)